MWIPSSFICVKLVKKKDQPIGWSFMERVTRLVCIFISAGNETEVSASSS